MMQRIADLPLFVLLMAVCALAMWVPAVYAVVVDDNETARAFFYSGVIWLLLTGLIGIVTSNYATTVAPRSNLLALVMAYAVLPVMAVLPIVQAVPDTSFQNAWFEMVSCFTTTGATVYDVAGRLPEAVHLWRAIMGWFGGLFILVAAMAVLAPLGLGGAELTLGHTASRATPGTRQVTEVADAAMRVRRITALIVPVYGGLTVLLWVALMMLGNSGDQALTFALGTLSTSGITLGPDMPLPNGGWAAEALLALFLCLAITRRTLPGLTVVNRRGKLRDDRELRLAMVIISMTATVVMLRHWHGQASLGQSTGIGDWLAAYWGAAFTTLSFLTTTGYQSAAWPVVSDWAGNGTPGLILIGLVIVGGGVATTAGGVKLMRVYALFRQGEHEVVRLIHPNAVSGRGDTARRLRQEGAYLAWIFFMIFALTLGGVITALSLTGLPFTDAMILAVSALTTTGPLAAVAGPAPISYAALSDVSRAVLALAMIIGRLEMLALLVLFAPDSWRR